MKYTDEQVHHLIEERDALAAQVAEFADFTRFVRKCVARNGEYAPLTGLEMHELLSAEPSKCLAKRDARMKAESTRHAASLAESEANSSSGEWQDAMYAFADLLDEVAMMQEAGDNGDCEEDS